MTKKELIDAMGVIFAYFNEKPNKGKLSVYWSVFKNTGIESFREAFSRYMSESKDRFFPMPAEIMEYVESKDCMTPEEAWIHCKEIVNGNWSHNPWDGISDPLMLKVSKSIGVEAFNRTENLSFAKRDFINSYTALSKPDARNRIGIFESGKEQHLFKDFSGILEGQEPF